MQIGVIDKQPLDCRGRAGEKNLIVCGGWIPVQINDISSKTQFSREGIILKRANQYLVNDPKLIVHDAIAVQVFGAIQNPIMVQIFSSIEMMIAIRILVHHSEHTIV